jgi:hypothetical protein
VDSLTSIRIKKAQEKQGIGQGQTHVSQNVDRIHNAIIQIHVIIDKLRPQQLVLGRDDGEAKLS